MLFAGVVSIVSDINKDISFFKCNKCKIPLFAIVCKKGGFIIFSSTSLNHKLTS